MSKSTLIGFVSGLAGAGFTYAILSKDTLLREGVTIPNAPNSSILNPPRKISSDIKFEKAIKRSRELLNIFRDELGIPGLAVGVSVDGNIIWEEGVGYANLETRTPCHANTAMRIGSISKPITTTLLAKLYESKMVDLDKSVYDYVSYFPRKKVNGEEVDMTVRQLASHTAGIRHYKKNEDEKDEGKKSGKEFYYKEQIESVEKSIEFFKNDELLFKPGTSFEYTTHGYTLLSAVIEGAGGKPFQKQIQELFRSLNLRNTYLDQVQKLIYGRASYYDKNKSGHIVNAELTDNSYKWAGGGFVSTVGDLLKFGNLMLYSYQQTKDDKPGYLKSETVRELWSPVDKTVMTWGKNAGYGLGWTIVPKIDDVGGVVTPQIFHVGHAGGAVGASSILLIVPKDSPITSDENNNNVKQKLPCGVVVAILVNLENTSCRALGQQIVEEFNKIST